MYHKRRLLMPTCFVIQPFDSGRFDKRFDDVYFPAIKAAGLEPYRVDRDPAVEVPITSIEEGIRNAAICLADITTDNPNVWYELGYAFAAGRPVIMVCSEERTEKRYPFDIQHRTIIPYQTEAPHAFEDLRASITERIKALSNRTEAQQLAIHYAVWGAKESMKNEMEDVTSIVRKQVSGGKLNMQAHVSILGEVIHKPKKLAVVYSFRNDVKIAEVEEDEYLTLP